MRAPTLHYLRSVRARCARLCAQNRSRKTNKRAAIRGVGAEISVRASVVVKNVYAHDVRAQRERQKGCAQLVPRSI